MPLQLAMKILQQQQQARLVQVCSLQDRARCERLQWERALRMAELSH